MKKWLPWIALTLCALLLVAVIVAGIWLLNVVNRANNAPAAENQSVEAFFQSAYDKFILVSYDSEAQSVKLQKQVSFSTYEQACSFGKDSLEELALGHVDTMKTMQDDCKASCGVVLKELTVEGISSDGQVIYTVHSDGTLEACWN